MKDAEGVDEHSYDKVCERDPPIPILPEQQERERAAHKWYIEMTRRKSEHKRKFDETGVDDIESSQ